MQLQAEQVLDLVDKQDREVGLMIVQRCEGDLVQGRFAPSTAFAQIEPLFRAFEDAVNSQALSVVDELDTAIAALGLHFRLPVDTPTLEIHDIQIWSDGSITFRSRVPRTVIVNGSVEVADAGHPVGTGKSSHGSR